MVGLLQSSGGLLLWGDPVDVFGLRWQAEHLSKERERYRCTCDSVRSMRLLFSSVRFSEERFSSSPSSLNTLTSSVLPRSSPAPLLTCGIVVVRASHAHTHTHLHSLVHIHARTHTRARVPRGSGVGKRVKKISDGNRLHIPHESMAPPQNSRADYMTP